MSSDTTASGIPMMTNFLVRAILPAMLIAAVAMSGCERRPVVTAGDATPAPATSGASGYIGGSVMLADAAESDHTGILVYLAGTSYSARTDKTGRYLISNVPEGIYTLVAEKSGYAPAQVDDLALSPTLHTKESPLTVRSEILEPTGGAVRTAGARGAAMFGSIGGNVTVASPGTPADVRVALDPTGMVTVTDETGRYQFVNVEPGEYTLRFSKAGYNGVERRAVVTEGSRALVEEVALSTGGTTTTDTAGATPTAPLLRQQLAGDRAIQGTVVMSDAEGNAITDYTGVVVALDNSDYLITPDANGAFRFVNLSPAVYRLIATVNGVQQAAQNVDLNNVQVASVQLRIGGATEGAGAGAVIGRVVLEGDDGQPLPDASGVQAGLSGTQYMATTNKAGRFRIENVPVGEYGFVATMQDYEDYKLERVPIAAGQVMDLGDIVMETKKDYPRVLKTNPADGARNITVADALAITVDFSKPMDPGAVRQAVVIEPQAPFLPYIGQGSHDLADDDTLVIVVSNQSAQNPIKFRQNYRITITEAAKDRTGLAMQDPYRFSFTTGAAGITRTIPEDGSPSAYIDQQGFPITVYFNTKLDRRTVDHDSFRIRPRIDIIYPMYVDEDVDTGWSIVRMFPPLQDDTRYTVTIDRTVRAANGQLLGNTPYTFRFQTARPERLESAPVIVE